MQLKFKILILLILHLAISCNTFAQEFIYRITVDQKTVVTGFKVAGQDGIVTALHGVAGAKRITVSKMSNETIYDDDVKIILWDLSKDICLISSSSINKIPKETGLKLSSIKKISKLNGVKVVIKGFPWSMPQYQTINVDVDGDHGIELLQNLLPADSSRSVLVKRKSPDIQQNVINLHGDIYPGHSGSPILYNNEVIGMVDGGLLLGSGYAWGIIYEQIKFIKFNNLDPGYKNTLNTNKALFSNKPISFSSINKDSTFNPGELPITIISIKKDLYGTLDFYVENNSPIDLKYVAPYVRYYGKDLTEVLDNSMTVITVLPIGQKAHLRVPPPVYIRNDYECIQFDLKMLYPEGVEFKKTYLNCDFQ